MIRHPVQDTALMRWASAASRAVDPTSAAREAADAVAHALGDGPIHLVLAFFAGTHVRDPDAIRDALSRRLAPDCLAGVSAAGVISASEEIEEGPALTVIAARMPGVTIAPAILPTEMWSEAVDAGEFAVRAPGVAGAEVVLFFADPFGLDVQNVLRSVNEHAPGTRVVGGLASAGVRPGANAFFLNEYVARDGGLFVALSGAVRADVVVSQGCRAIGRPMTVSRAEANVLVELDGKPALERMQEVLAGLTDEERDHADGGLFLGRPVRPDASGRGDYVIRNVIGADRRQGVVAVADIVGTGERVRLHVRDGVTAREDLEMLLVPQALDTRAQAALVFSCNGRGTHLYDEGNGDIGPLQAALGGAVPAAGFFCAGEFGPVGSQNFLHGHTASIVIMRPRTSTEGEGS